MSKKFLFVLILITSCTTIGLGYKKYGRPHHKPATTIIVPPPTTPPKVEPKPLTFDDVLSTINQEDLKKNVAYLASDALEGRMSGKAGNVKAAEYLKQQFESFGLPTMYDKFSIRRTNPGPKNESGDNSTQNVYAWIEGNDSTMKDEIIVIGAHFDHIGYGPAYSRTPNQRKIHPGADDNASGTAAVLAIAKAFAQIKGQIKRTVVFQLYSAEEMGLLGSEAYCKSPKFPQSQPSMSKHAAMINLDMIGYLGKGGSYMVRNLVTSSIDLKQMAEELASKYTFSKQVCNFGGGNGGSDHYAFYNKGVPVVFLHTGLHKAYHTPSDVAEALNYEGMEKITKFALELAWKAVQSDVKVKFNYGDFVELPITHDHGMVEVPFGQE